jgi:response regulator NasT
MRVLIADDDAIIRLDLRQMLSSLGYEVVGEAEDGSEAVDLASKLQPDVCVFDVKMPKLDGIDAAKAVAGKAIAPVVLLTAFSDRQVVERASEAGVFGFLAKPYKPSDLTPAIEVARARFEQNRQLTEEVADLKERLAARRVIEQAKGLLMEREGLSEAEAYRRIQVASMSRRTSMREVADQIVAEGRLPD